MIKPTTDLNVNLEAEKLKALYKIDFEKKAKESKNSKTKFTMLNFGGKGTGKTTTVLLSPPTGKKVVFSFDGRTKIIKEQLVREGLLRDEDVTVYNILDDFIDSPEQSRETGFLAYEYLIYLFENEVKNKGYDYIIFDGLDFYNRIAEMRMRYIKKCPAFGSIDLNFWKLRTSYLMTTHRLALKYAKKGVLYTAYYDEHSEYTFKAKDGTELEKKGPKYIELVDKEIDYMLENELVILKDKDKKIIRATVLTSKNDRLLPTGKMFDINNYKMPFSEEDLKKWYPHLFTEEKKKEEIDYGTQKLVKEIVEENTQEEESVGDFY